jgi:hypothetical protein
MVQVKQWNPNDARGVAMRSNRMSWVGFAAGATFALTVAVAKQAANQRKARKRSAVSTTARPTRPNRRSNRFSGPVSPPTSRPYSVGLYSVGNKRVESNGAGHATPGWWSDPVA